MRLTDGIVLTLQSHYTVIWHVKQGHRAAIAKGFRGFRHTGRSRGWGVGAMGVEVPPLTVEFTWQYVEDYNEL